MPIDAAAGGPYGPPPLGQIATKRTPVLKDRAEAKAKSYRFQSKAIRVKLKAAASLCQVPLMPLNDLVASNAILPALKVNNKKQVLHELAARAAVLTGQNERAIFDILMQREKLGSTAVGNGIAIPHGKMANLTRLFGLFARLDRPVDFEALDGQPVDLVFLLLAPEGAGADHLKALARVARLLLDPAIAHKLRASHDAEALYAVLTMPSATAA